MQPAKIANNKYIVPMSLWFVEQSQRLKNVGAWSWPSAAYAVLPIVV